MPNYTKLQTFQTGQVVGRAQMNTLRDNDNYFYGLASRWRPCMHGPSIGGTAGQTTTHFWNGYHLLRDDATLLYYWFQIAGGAANGVTASFVYYKDNGTGYSVASGSANAGQTTTVSDSVDLSNVSGITAGLHQVRFTLTHDSSDTGSAVARPPYTTYTGNEAYTTPPVIRDEATSAVSHFNTWRSNDEYFQACSPTNPAFHMISMGDPVDGDSEIIWDGWIPHSTAAEEVYYKVKFSTDANSNRLVIYYDYGGANQYYHVVDTPEVYETSSFALPSNTYQSNTWYRVVVKEQRTNGNPGAYVWVDYLYMGPRSTLEVTGAVPDFTVGAWVYGDDTKYPTRLAQLSNWDNTIFKALCWNALVGRADFAVRDDTALGPYNPITTHRLVHIYDFLWYRGTGLALRWGGDNSRSLPDTDATNPVLVMDLRSVTDLTYGQHYRITGNVDFAQEAVYSA